MNLYKKLILGVFLTSFSFIGQSQINTDETVEIWLPNPSNFIKYSYVLSSENTIIHNPRFVTKLNQEEHQYNFTPYTHKNQLSVYNFKSFYSFLSKEIYLHLDQIDTYSDSIISDSLFTLIGVSKILSRKTKYLED